MAPQRSKHQVGFACLLGARDMLGDAEVGSPKRGAGSESRKGEGGPGQTKKKKKKKIEGRTGFPSILTLTGHFFFPGGCSFISDYRVLCNWRWYVRVLF